MSPGFPDESMIGEAAQWLALLQSGQASAEELRAFEQWQAGDPLRAQVVRQMSLGLGGLQGGCVQGLSSERLLQALNTPRSSRRQFVHGSLAVAGVALVGLWASRWQGEEGEILQTGTGERRDLLLPDGSRLVLDARSQVAVRFDTGQRLVQLTRGQLLVDVRHDPTRPLLVATAEGRIRALGTRFQVEQQATGTQLTMLHSRVEVTTLGGQRAEVGEGQQIRFEAQRLFALESVRGDATAWIEGRLEVRDRSLGEVIEQLRRYRPGIIRVSAAAARLRLSGIYPLDDSERSLQLLAKSLPIRISRHSDYWVSIDVP